MHSALLRGTRRRMHIETSTRRGTGWTILVAVIVEAEGVVNGVLNAALPYRKRRFATHIFGAQMEETH